MSQIVHLDFRAKSAVSLHPKVRLIGRLFLIWTNSMRKI